MTDTKNIGRYKESAWLSTIVSVDVAGTWKIFSK